MHQCGLILSDKGDNADWHAICVFAVSGKMDQVDARRPGNSRCHSLCGYKDFNLSIWHYEALEKTHMHISNHTEILPY